MVANHRLVLSLLCTAMALFVSACAAPPAPADPVAKDPTENQPVAKDPVAKDPKVIPGAGSDSVELKYDPRPRKKEASKTPVAKTGTGETPKTETKTGTVDLGSLAGPQTTVKVVVFKELPKRSVIDHALEGADAVALHIDTDLSAVALAGSAKAVGGAADRLKPLGVVDATPAPRIRTGSASLYAVYLKNIGSDKVIRFVRSLLTSRVEILVRPNSGAIIFEGDAEAVALAVSLALQLDGQSADFGAPK